MAVVANIEPNSVMYCNQSGTCMLFSMQAAANVELVNLVTCIDDEMDNTNYKHILGLLNL